MMDKHKASPEFAQRLSGASTVEMRTFGHRFLFAPSDNSGFLTIEALDHVRGCAIARTIPC